MPSLVMSSNFTFRDAQDISAIFMDLATLSIDQRIIFSVFVLILLICSVISNTATLVVGVKRKIRPFFRTCLICLATSDLLSSVFSGTTYLSQYSVKYVQVWSLGSLMCTLGPFMSTVAILANSITLVGIAVDRYLSGIRLIKNIWDSKGTYCVIFAIIIWGLSVGIATPTLTAYKHLSILIVELDPENNTQITAMIPAYLCAASKKDNARYYMILLCILFIPIVMAFIWFNSILAYEIWNRRKTFRQSSWLSSRIRSKKNSHTSSEGNAALRSSSAAPVIATMEKGTEYPSKKTRSLSSKLKTTNLIRVRSNRDSRQLRMFSIIILLMVMFIVFRMPVWIYLILKFHNTYLSTFHWILQYTFGILSLFGCALNPFLYAFLTQTIQYAVTIYRKSRGCFGLKKFFVAERILNQDIGSTTAEVDLTRKMEIYVIAKS